jgi:PAS domain S-box-containing protein
LRDVEGERRPVFGIEGEARMQQLALMVASVVDYAIFLLDPGGYILTWNPGAQRIKGYTEEEIVGRHFSTFYTDKDRARNHPDNELEIAAAEGRYEEESWRVRKDGTQFWANVVITAIRDETGDLVGYGKVTRDLTERRAGEEALREAQQRLEASNEELRRFASVAAHDLNEPLRTIAGMADLLVKRHLDALPEDGRQFLGHISSSAERMGHLIDSLLDYTRAGHAPRSTQPVGVRDAARRVADDLAAMIVERGAELTLDVDPAAEVTADPADVELLLQNLLSNALKFGDPQTPTVRVTCEPAGVNWRIVVADNGAGIAPEDQPRIFEAFHRAHPDSSLRGTGLGLAICERIVQRHGGAIGVESRPGDGSRFWVYLPAA